MQNTTTPTISALESIDFNLLSAIIGGCGGGGCKKRCCPAPPAPVQQCQVLQMPAAPAPLPPAPQGPPPPSGDSVSTSVSINGVPQS
jgi:hypothetical protein